MEQQHNVLVVDKPPVPFSVVAVVPGPGFEQIARELGAEVALVAIQNPSVRDLSLAINKCLSDTVYLFVNDKNVALAAQQAAKLSGRTVHVLPTADVIAGIAGLLALRTASESLPATDEVMQAAGRTKSAQVFFAGKDATVGGTSVQRGKPAASSSGVLYAGGSLGEAATAALQAMGARDGGLITVYYGGAQKERDAQRLSDELRATFPQADVEYYYGGQKNAEYWVSLDD
jgi:hypothetical protein